MQNSFELNGWIVDIEGRRTYPGTVCVKDGIIDSINEDHDNNVPHHYIIPGFIDSHVHIESSMLIPSEFARIAVTHGTIATVSDPHEIANVCGMEGVEFMIEDGHKVPFQFYFGAPSCVPATGFESAGAVLDSNDIKTLLNKPEIHYLAEMMNFPGVLNKDEEVMKKIAHAHRLNKPVDGHAPALRGEDAKNYIAAGISTDHECFTSEEALEKLDAGMKILIREGSAAKNFDALVELLHEHYHQVMFCSDDKHPDSLVEGHINTLCARAVQKGVDVYKVLRAACINPVLHYRLHCGMLLPGGSADIVVLEDLKHFRVKQTYINGIKVAEEGKTLINRQDHGAPINHFHCSPVSTESIKVPYRQQSQVPVIEAYDGQLITGKIMLEPKVVDGNIVTDTGRDMIKIVVVNRYHEAPPAVAFIKNTGIGKGAIASSVAHDSHNIVAVGADDESIVKAINMVIEHKGGISCVWVEEEQVLPLPVAGLMSMDDGFEVARKYTAIDALAKKTGSTLSSPFMTISFMALLVIPHLKLSDKGLFDGDRFELMC